MADVQHESDAQTDTRRVNDRDDDDFRIVTEREMSRVANSRDGKRTEWEPRLPRGPVLLYTVGIPHSRFSYRYLYAVERKSDQ